MCPTYCRYSSVGVVYFPIETFVASFGRFFIILIPLETGMNTPQSHVIYLLNAWFDDVITV